MKSNTHFVLRKISFITMTIIMGACAPVMMAHKEKVARVQRVAIVAFSLDQEMANGVTINFNGPDRGIKADRPKVDLLRIDPIKEMERASNIEPTPHSEQIYAKLRERLSKKFSSQVLTLEEVRNNETYQRLNHHRTWTIHRSSRSPYPVHHFGVSAIGPFHLLMSLTDSERRELLTALNVDAVVALRLNVRLNRNDRITIGRFSLGTYKPSANAEISMMGTEDEEYWRDAMAEGEASSGETIELSGVTDYSKLEENVIETSERSFDTLWKHYQNAPSEGDR